MRMFPEVQARFREVYHGFMSLALFPTPVRYKQVSSSFSVDVSGRKAYLLLIPWSTTAAKQQLHWIPPQFLEMDLL